MSARSKIAPTRRSMLRWVASAAVGTAAVPLAGTRAFAAWPERPIKLIVPFAAGGPSDIIARVMAAAFQEALGNNPVIVENKGGAGGNIGIGSVARADPDGYTLLVTSSAFVLNPSLYANVPYDPFTDFAPISEMVASPNVFLARPDLGVSSIKELVALARKEPDKLNYGSPGVGTTPQLAAELLKVREKINMVQVQHAGAGPAVQAILSGTVPVACVALPPAQPHILAGKLKALAVTSEKRASGLPDVPTMTELGYKDFVLDTMQALLAPAKTPPEIVERLAKLSVEILARPAVQEKLKAGGFEVIGKGPDGLKARIAREVPMMKEIVAQAGIKAK